MGRDPPAVGDQRKGVAAQISPDAVQQHIDRHTAKGFAYRVGPSITGVVDDSVGAEPSYQCELVSATGRSHDLRTETVCELNEQRSHAARSPQDQHPVARLDADAVDDAHGGHAVVCETSRFPQAQAVGDRHK